MSVNIVVGVGIGAQQLIELYLVDGHIHEGDNSICRADNKYNEVPYSRLHIPLVRDMLFYSFVIISYNTNSYTCYMTYTGDETTSVQQET